MRTRWLFAGLMALNLVACASPRERAHQESINEYKRKNAVVVDYARGKVKQLVTATKTFQAAANQWPQTLQELATFAFNNHVPFDPTDFNDVTLASLEDGSVQVRYDVNCSRFNNPQYSFTQTGTVNVKAEGKR